MSAPSKSTDQLLTEAAEAATLAAAAAMAAAKAVATARAGRGEEPVPEETHERMPFADIQLPAPPPDATRRTPAMIYLARVHFYCPACRRLTVLSIRRCGELVSCPKCFTGIRVPDPRRKRPAENFGRTLQPMLHPDRFDACLDAHHVVPWLIRHLPTAVQGLATSGAALLIAATVAMSPVTLRWASLDIMAAAGPHALLRPAPPARRDLPTEATAAVQQFLAAATPEAKAAWVTDADRTIPRMADWYARHPGGGVQSDAVIGPSSQGFYATPGDPMVVSEVPVELEGHASLTYLVEHRPEGPRIAWAESVGYSPMAWKRLVGQFCREQPVRLRLLACRDDYYNYAFAASSEFSCIRLHDPQTMELLGFGYVRRTEEMDQTLEISLPPAEAVALRPVTVDILPCTDSATTQQVEIIGPVIPGWKDHAPAALGTLARL